MAQQNKYLTEFIDTLLQIENKKEMKEFLDGILTPQEMEDIPVRLQIIKMLKEGIPQRKIAAELGVGIATVTRGSNELKKGRFKKIAS
jgi:TrpR family trp operon transcriptional repressor